MELPRELPVGADIARYDASTLCSMRGPSAGALASTVDAMAMLSCRAQRLAEPISTAEKLHSNPGQRLYMMFDQAAHLAVGILKVGRKHLFIMDVARQHEIEPLCVLDFYVHESRQRSGFGRELFEHVLRAEGVEPHRLAYDRPSPKLLGFLRKHYGLSRYTPQPNNFVLFADYFSGTPRTSSGRGHQAAPLVPGAGRARAPSARASPPARAAPLDASPDASAWAAAADGSPPDRGGSAGPASRTGSRQERQRRGGATVVSAPPSRNGAGGRGASGRGARTAGRAPEPQPEPQQWSPGGAPTAAATGQAVDERTRQAREMALLSLTKAAANCMTATEEDARELGRLVDEALAQGHTTTENVMLMATNLKRGRSSVSYFKETWRARLKEQERGGGRAEPAS